MMETLKRYWEEIVKFYQQLDKQRRIVLLGGGAATLIALILLVHFSTRTVYSTLFSGLEQSEAGVIVNKLKEMNVDYRLTDGGSTIQVPREKVYDLRLQMASAGLLQLGTIGYEIFDHNNIGATDFVQKINYRRALEGELSRTIATLNEVKAARVHLVIPEPSLFVEDQKPTTASVTLKLIPGRRLNANQIQGITNLVAASVEGLKPEHVTIVDSYGNVLTQPPESENQFTLTATQMELKRNVEQYYTDKLKKLLEKVVGKDRVAVQVTAELNFDRVERSVTTFDPDNLVVVSEQRNVQTMDSGTATGKPQKSENITTNYEVSKTVARIVQDGANINRLSVAVMVDGKYELPPGADKDAQPQYVPRSQEEITQLTEVVKGAIGFSAQRQDEVKVVNMPFDHTLTDIESKEWADYEKRLFWETWLRRVLTLVLAGGILFGLWKVLRSFKTVFLPHRQGSEILPLESSEEGEMSFELPSDIKNNVRLQQTIAKLTRERPAESAKLLKAWLVEEAM